MDDGLYDYFSENIRQSKIAYRIENNFPEDFPLTGGHRDWISDNRGGYPNQFFASGLKLFRSLQQTVSNPFSNPDQ